MKQEKKVIKKNGNGFAIPQEKFKTTELDKHLNIVQKRKREGNDRTITVGEIQQDSKKE